ncbi:MAG: methylase, partial [Kiritimatiellae bacterium]|nr:methylase [Kiritimatiellia bacterium]
QGTLDFDGDTVKVSIRQFHGIECNDFACRVAQTALWIAENQMLRETESLLHRNLDFLPLKTYDGIVEGNALRIDWATLAPHFDFIIGNPPFVGASMMTPDQKSEAVAIFGKGRRVNSIDYVGAWFHKAAELMRGTATRAAFVATNSITQGEQVAPLWKPLVERFGLSIDFAHRTFRWDSESNSKAHVHCVIVGFSCGEKNHTDLLTPNGVREDVSRVSGEQIRVLKPIFEGDRVQRVPHVNAYLVSAPDAFVESRGTPLCDVPPMTYGNKPSDDGNLLLSEPERDAILRETPALAPFVRRYVGARDFIANDEIRYCLWLKDASPALYHGSREVMRRLAAVREFRLASSAAPTRALADQPWRFFSAPQTEENYLLVPEVSSERRRYVPVGFMDARIIAANTVSIVPGATLYHFGVVTSNVHNAWMRTVAGRLEMRYRYSGAIVYNNFPWPGAEKDPARPVHLCVPAPLRERIEQTAQAILDARAAHPAATLADLYDELTMPPDLREAHQENDRAVMAAYGFSTKMSESECVAGLFKRYQTLVAAAKGAKK